MRYQRDVAVPDMIKKLTIILSIFPGSLFALALVSFVICTIAELGLSGGSANIGLGLLFIAFVINIPTIVVWIIHLSRRGYEPLPKNSNPRP